MQPGPHAPPTSKGRFRIEAELAHGGMGTVFSAIDASTGQRVALKRLSREAPARASALFEREFHVLSSLKHPRIIQVHDYGVDDDGPYYTMELLEGADLRELSPLPEVVACGYLRDVASSLALLHARRLLHRDVSPRNVRTSPAGGCKLIDFGGLMSFGASEDLVGTPPAIPPEALSGEPMDQRADLFALGALGYYVLTGRHAYPARKVSELSEVWRGEVVPPSRFSEGVSSELDGLLLSLLNLERLARPGSAAEVIERLQVIAGIEPDRDQQAARAYFVGAALVERGHELGRVGRRLSRARAGSGSSIYVDANPGAGKTRFLAEVALGAQVGGTSVLRVDGAGHTGRLSTARALTHRLARQSPHVVAEFFAAHATVLQAVWPEILGELELEPPRDPGDREAALVALPAILEACLRNIAEKMPLLISVDNVDRADLVSVALLLALSRATRDRRLVVMTTASVRTSAELSPAVRALREVSSAIRLRELTSEGVEELVRTAFGNAPHTRRTAMRVFTATEGNPGRCMRLLQGFVDEGLIRYDAGAWTLPLQIPPEKLGRPEIAATNRLRDCSPDARRAATLLSIIDETTPLEWFVAFEEGSTSSRQVIAAFDELSRAEIVADGPEGYWFSASTYSVAAADDADDATLDALRLRVSEALLAAADAPRARIVAGLHLIRGHQELRGADIIASAAKAVLAHDDDPARTLESVSAALEAALEVYRRHGKGNLALLGLLVPLVVASYEISPAFAERYGAETVERLERALGLRGPNGETVSHDLESLIRALGAAPVLLDGETSNGAPDFVMLVGWLISAVVTLTAVASAVIDHAAQERFAKALLPFMAFGSGHPAAFAYEFCRLIVGMTEDRLADSHAGWSAMLTRLDEVPLPPQLLRRLRRGAICALGILESQRDDSAALARIAQLEALGGRQDATIAKQLGLLYHGFRGESDLAQQCRERVEEYAVQHGSAWQIEIWSTCTASAICGNTRDAAGNKRVLEQLERLKKTSPSLELYAERTRALQYKLTGANDLALEAYLSTLAKSSPRARVGWSAVRGALASVYNDLGKYELARDVCEETLALCADDFDFVAMTLGPRIELCRALAGVGDVAGAKARLGELLDRYAPNENAATLGAIHRTFAEVALAEGDTPAFEQHLSAMRRWVAPTKNPALIGQCERLRQMRVAPGGLTVAQAPAGGFMTAAQTLIQSVFASCEGEAARRHRALELAGAQAGVREAWLFTADASNDPIMVGRLGVCDAPGDLVTLVKELFDDVEDDVEETALIQGAPLTETFVVPGAAYRLLPLTVSQGSKRMLIGTIALPMTPAIKPVGHDLLQEIASQLYQAGDIATVRTFS